MVFKVPSNKKHSVILWSWLWRMFTHTAFFASKQWCVRPINKLTTATTPLGYQHNPEWEGVTMDFFLQIILNKTCVGGREPWTSIYCKFVGAVVIRFFFGAKETPPFRPLELSLVSNVANLTLPVPSSPTFDGEPGIVWPTYASRSVDSPLKSATTGQLFLYLSTLCAWGLIILLIFHELHETYVHRCPLKMMQ